MWFSKWLCCVLHQRDSTEPNRKPSRTSATHGKSFEVPAVSSLSSNIPANNPAPTSNVNIEAPNSLSPDEENNSENLQENVHSTGEEELVVLLPTSLPGLFPETTETLESPAMVSSIPSENSPILTQMKLRRTLAANEETHKPINQSTEATNEDVLSKAINQSTEGVDDEVLIGRPKSLLELETHPRSKTTNDLLTPEVLEDPEALAALGFAYPPGYGPPLPPLPLDVVLSLACKHRCVVSPHDLEIHEMCRSPSSNTSGFSSGDFRVDVEEKDSPSGEESTSSAEADRNLIRKQDFELEFLSCDFPVELDDVQKLLQLGVKATTENGADCSDLISLQIMFSALGIVDCGNLKNLFPVVRHRENETIADFILTQSVAGLNPEEMISEISKISEKKIFGKFFPTNSRPKNSFDELVEPENSFHQLDKFLGFWMKRGAVPILCLNLQPGGKLLNFCGKIEERKKNENVFSSSWQFRVVFGVDQGRIHFLTPIFSLNLQNVWECLDTPPIQIVSPEFIFNSPGISGISREMGDISALRFLDDDLNVLGQLAYFMEMRKANSPERISTDPLLQDDILRLSRAALEPSLNFVSLPTRMRNGILLFARTDNVHLCRLLQSF